jgi:hypothetical protein
MLRYKSAAPFNPSSSASENRMIISFYGVLAYKKPEHSRIVATPEPASLAPLE